MTPDLRKKSCSFGTTLFKDSKSVMKNENENIQYPKPSFQP